MSSMTRRQFAKASTGIAVSGFASMALGKADKGDVVAIQTQRYRFNRRMGDVRVGVSIWL